MPELPDIEVFAHNIKKQYAGKQLKKLEVVAGKKLKDKPEELSKALEGQTLEDVYRSGKEFRLKFSNGVILGLHLMLTGDLHPFESTNERKATIVEFHFKDGTGLALTDRMKNAFVKLDPVDKGGVDALSSDLNYNYLKKAFKRKTEVKNIFLDQDVIRGIGNGYSDEILWEAKISPHSTAEAIPNDVIKRLPGIIKKVLTTATDTILKLHPGIINREVKDYQKIHHQKVSPTGFEIHMDQKGMRKTYYTNEQVLYK